MLLLERKNKLDYCKIVPSNYEFLENYENMNLSKFLFIREDLQKGMQHYFYSNTNNVATEFTPGANIHLPIFNIGKVQLEMGLMRLRCTNGLTDTKDITPVKMNANDKFLADNLSNILHGLMSSVDEIGLAQVKMIDYFKEKPIDTTTAKLILEEHRERINCNQVTNACLRHIELVNKNVEIPDESPKEIKSMYDFINLLTYYSSHNDSITQNSKQTTKISRYIKGLYQDQTNICLYERQDLNKTYSSLIKV